MPRSPRQASMKQLLFVLVLAFVSVVTVLQVYVETQLSGAAAGAGGGDVYGQQSIESRLPKAPPPPPFPTHVNWKEFSSHSRPTIAGIGRKSPDAAAIDNGNDDDDEDVGLGGRRRRVAVGADEEATLHNEPAVEAREQDADNSVSDPRMATRPLPLVDGGLADGEESADDPGVRPVGGRTEGFPVEEGEPEPGQVETEENVKLRSKEDEDSKPRGGGVGEGERSESDEEAVEHERIEEPDPPPPPPPPPPPTPTAAPAAPDQLMLLGMHHSGTSLLMQAALSFGLYGGFLGEFELQQPPKHLRPTAPPDWWPAKWWERHDVVNLNRMLMEPVREQRDKWAAGFHFAGLDQFPLTEKRVFKYRAKRVIDRLNKRRPWIIKEPRLCITLGSAWRPLLQKPACIILYRHPSFVAAGLLRHWPKVNQQFTTAEWLAIWEKYTVSALRSCQGLPTVFVSHEMLTINPFKAVSLLATHLKLLGVNLTYVDRDPSLPPSDREVRRERRDGMRLFSEKTITSIFNGSYFQPGKNDARDDLTAKQQLLFTMLDQGDFSAPFTDASREALKPFIPVSRPEAKSGYTKSLSLSPGFVSIFDRDDSPATVSVPEDQLDQEGQVLTDVPLAMGPSKEPDYNPWWSEPSRKNLGKRYSKLSKVVDKSDQIMKPNVRSLLSIDDNDDGHAPIDMSDEIGRVVRRHVNQNGTLVGVYGNSAFEPLIRNWICHARTRFMEPSKLVVFALDSQLCGKLAGFHDACVYDARWWAAQSDSTQELTESARWKDTTNSKKGSILPSKQSYFLMLLFKIHYAQLVVDMGFDLFLSDADTVFFSDPMSVFETVDGPVSEIDLLIQSDSRSASPRVSADWVCAGNMWLRSSETTRQFLGAVAALMADGGLSDQDAIQLLLSDSIQSSNVGSSRARASLNAALRETSLPLTAPRLTARLLDPLVFPNGGTYFVDKLPQRFHVPVRFVHANMNWDKLTTLQTHGLWKLATDQLMCI